MICIVLAAILIPVATVAVWARRTVLDEHRFTTTVSQVTSDPAVISAASVVLTKQLEEAVTASGVLDNLPSQLQPIAKLAQGAVYGRITERVDDLLSSDAGQKVLLLAVTQAHRSAMRLLEGDGLLSSDAFTVGNGKITLNLIPLARLVMLRLQDDGIIPSSISIPPPDAPPGAFNSALANRLPPDFGQVVVYDSGSASNRSVLDDAQHGLVLAKRGVALLVILALAFAVAAVAVAVRRRRAVFLVGAGIVGMSLLLIVVSRRVAAAVPNATTTVGARAVATALATSLRSSLVRALLIVALLAAVMTIAAWQYHTLIRLAGRYPDAARIVVVAVGLVILLVLGLTWLGVIIAVLIVALGLLAVQQARQAAPSTPAAIE
jgi:hypothetical protein